MTQLNSAFLTESLAGTGRVYVVGQMTNTGYGSKLHFQVQAPGVDGNRSYGLAFNTEMPDVAERALAAATQRALSLAQTGKEYAVVRIKPIGSDILHVQVRGESVNRPAPQCPYDGAAFNVSAPEWAVEAIRSLRE